jgi:hypothetical protein
MSKKILICFFGVISRSIKYTYKNHQEKLIDILKKKYDVKIYGFNNNVENILVDNIKQNNNDIKLISFDHFEEKKQSDIDNEIDYIVNSKNINCKMRPDYTKKLIQNSIRQMYSEEQVCIFIENNIDNYDCCIICGPDYFLLDNINLNHVNNCIKNDVIYTTKVNDGNGYTNGFYIGTPKLLVKILKRFSILHKLLPTKYDYEYLLKRVFIMNNLTRLITDMKFIKIRSNKRIDLQGIMRKSCYNITINKISKKFGFFIKNNTKKVIKGKRVTNNSKHKSVMKSIYNKNSKIKKRQLQRRQLQKKRQQMLKRRKRQLQRRKNRK